MRYGIDINQFGFGLTLKKATGVLPVAPILSRAINNDNLRKTGYPTLSDYYRKVTS